jgi:hypothetical protein
LGTKGEIRIMPGEVISVGNNSAREFPAASGGRNILSASDLIRLAQEHPPEPIIAGLVCVGDTMLIHGSEESFKSVFVIQIAESICLARPLLRQWDTPSRRRVGIIETEMHPAMLGDRLQKMYPDGHAPEQMVFMDEGLLQNWRVQSMEGKFRIVEDWISANSIEVLMIDTANDFFRGVDNPSAETIAGGFFDRLRNLRVKGRVIVRHDRKQRIDDAGAHSNERIRGSSEFKEDPEAILSVRRLDKRTHEVELEVGKLRYGRKPEPIRAWFDASCFRLTPIPPVITVLEAGRRPRQEIVAECSSRFGLSERTTDQMLNDYRPFLREGQDGHSRTFEMDAARASEAPWACFLTHPAT